MNRTILLTFFAILVSGLVMSAEMPTVAPGAAVVIDYAARRADGTWKKANDPSKGLGCRELFSCALALCEAGQHPERLEKLFEVAAAMQDHDKASKGYGNFRWYWANEAVEDFNAVDFCMQSAMALWLRHRDNMPEAAKKKLKDIIDLAVEGCVRHKVRDTYTNIALMNAGNLVLLGETLDRPAVAEEGYTRFNNVVKRTLASGIAEYGSPTYYGVDVDDLLMMEAFCKRPEGRVQAQALLELFWTDMAMNWLPSACRLAGPHSRDYDYLHGLGQPLDKYLWYYGWITGPVVGGAESVLMTYSKWVPPPTLLERSRGSFPRLVRQAWGVDPVQSRTHYLLKDVSLGSASANYHNMDVPLTVDFAGERTMPRCYFIPDCRNDPYGKQKIKEGKGPHSKTLHLRPFWTAAQRTTDAVGLVFYKKEDMLLTATALKSHFIMPKAVDGFWIGDKKVDRLGTTPTNLVVGPGEALFMRKGSAALGVKVPWTCGAGGRPVKIEFVDDCNPENAVRLTVTHYEDKDVVPEVKGAGAAFWVRIAGGLTSDSEFEGWRKAFTESKAVVEASTNRVLLLVPSKAGSLRVGADYPDGKNVVLEPQPARVALELDGVDVGKAMLERVVKP